MVTVSCIARGRHAVLEVPHVLYSSESDVLAYARVAMAVKRGYRSISLIVRRSRTAASAASRPLAHGAASEASPLDARAPSGPLRLVRGTRGRRRRRRKNWDIWFNFTIEIGLIKASQPRTKRVQIQHNPMITPHPQYFNAE